MTRRCEREEYGFWKRWRFDRELFGRLLRYGLPTGFQFFVDIAAFSTFIFLVGRLGTEQLAATNLAFNVNTLAFIPMLGCGTAVMTLVGRRIGEGRPEIAIRTTWLACGACCSYMLGFAIIFLFLPDVILYPFSLRMPADEYVVLRDQAIVLLRFLAVFSVFDGMAIIFGSAVRGAGDTRFSLVFTLMTSWLLMVVPTWICWRWYGGNLIGSWTACTVYICVLGVGLMIRFQSGQWKTMRVIEQSATRGQDENDVRLDAHHPDALPEAVSAIDEINIHPGDRVHDEFQQIPGDRP
jgi:MATE family multidrug resistance protein